MTGIQLNTLFRTLIIGLPLIFYLFKKNKIKLDIPIAFLVLNVLFSEFYILAFPRSYNLVFLSIILISESLIIGWLIYSDIRKIWTIITCVIPTLLFFGFFLFTELSSAQLFGVTDKFRYVTPINANQFFDLCAIHNLSFIVVLFAWLYATLNDKIINKKLNKKRLVYIFVFLAYFASSFFSIAFGRYLTSDLNAWYAMWGMVFIPLYLLFYSTLNIMLFWNPERS